MAAAMRRIYENFLAPLLFHAVCLSKDISPCHCCQFGPPREALGEEFSRL